MSAFDSRRERRRFIITGAVLASVLLCGLANDASPGKLFDSTGMGRAGKILSGFASPDFSPEFLVRILGLSIESLLIGALGTCLACVIGIVLAVAATKLPALPDAPGGSFFRAFGGAAVRGGARFLLSFFRTIPDIVWAYIFVRLIGLGPGPGILAIGIMTGGSIGKLYAELAEAVDPRPIRSLAATGVGRVGCFLYGVLPQVRQQWVAYALFRLECSVRTASILGVVGAGGLGAEIALDLRYFQYDKLATALMAVLALVIGLEWVASRLRARPASWTFGVAAVVVVIGLLRLPVPWSELATLDTFHRSFGLFEGAGPASPGLLPKALLLMVQTLTMAWVATVLAFAVAVLLSPLASATLTVRDYLRDGHRASGLRRIPPWILLLSSRFLLQVTRALPELTLALIFVVWVGPGPFAGILAVAVHTVGVLGRLYLDSYEMVEPEPVAALESIGSSRLGAWLYGVLPQAAPRVLAYSLYRFEVNIRATAIVGFVGAGGIGEALHAAISLFHIGDLILYLGVMLGVVAVVDFIGDRIRQRILNPVAGVQPVEGAVLMDDVSNRQLTNVHGSRRRGRRDEISHIIRYRPYDGEMGEFTTARVLNLSPKGMFICSEAPVAPGTTLEVELPDPDRLSNITVFCRVVSTRAPDPGGGEAAGLGVALLNPSSAALRSIAVIVDRGQPFRHPLAR